MFLLKYYKYLKRYGKQKSATALNYFLNFGWIALLVIASLALILIFLTSIFHWVFLLLLLILFLFFPMKLIYALVGGSNSLRVFFVLFLVTQLLFSGLYYKQINYSNYTYEETNESVSQDLAEQPDIHENDEQNSDNCRNEKEKEKNEEIPYMPLRQVVLNTFYIALIQEVSPVFEGFIDNRNNEIMHDRLFIILNIQIFISWLYLGVLIASLYHRISNR